MLRVGLTGGIGSGKSTVAKMFQDLGAYSIDADQLGRKAEEPGQPALTEISRAFGPDVLHTDGTLNRSVLAGIVFSDPKALARLNAIVHPRIWEEGERLVAVYEAQDPAGVVVLDAAVLIEAGFAERMDIIVVVDVDESDQLQRLASKGMVSEDACSRIRSQLPQEERLKCADFVIDNRGALGSTSKQVKEIWNLLVLRNTAKKH